MNRREANDGDARTRVMLCERVLLKRHGAGAERHGDGSWVGCRG